MTATTKLAPGSKTAANDAGSGSRAPSGPYVLNLCSSTTPMALAKCEQAELRRFSFFVSRRFEEGRERFRLHMGFFDSLDEAQEWLGAVREIYPGAWAGEAPGKKLRERAAARATTAGTTPTPSRELMSPPRTPTANTAEAKRGGVGGEDLQLSVLPEELARRVPTLQPAGSAESAPVTSTPSAPAAQPPVPASLAPDAVAPPVFSGSARAGKNPTKSKTSSRAKKGAAGRRAKPAYPRSNLREVLASLDDNSADVKPTTQKAANEPSRDERGRGADSLNAGSADTAGSGGSVGAAPAGAVLPANAPPPAAAAPIVSAAQPATTAPTASAAQPATMAPTASATPPAGLSIATSTPSFGEAPIAAVASTRKVTVGVDVPARGEDAYTDTEVLQLLESRRGDGPEYAGANVDAGAISLLKPSDAATLRALKQAVTENAAVSFAVQLQWSVQPVDLATVPPLAIFSAYTLYTVEGSRDGRKWYGLRLGFFSDANSAKQVAYYVRSEFASVAVVPVSPQERTHASDSEGTSTGVAARRPTRAKLVEEFKLIDSDMPSELPKPREPVEIGSGVASPTGHITKRRMGGRVVARDKRSPHTLEETLEILGAGELEIDDGRGETLTEVGARNVHVQPHKTSAFSKLLVRLTERVRKA